MTDKPNHKQIQQACDLANAKPGCEVWIPKEYGRYGSLTALADTIAQLDAMQAERDKAKADLGEIDKIADDGGWSYPDSSQNCQAVANIAARHRVETDPLVEALVAANAQLCDSEEGYAPILRAELAKRGLEIGRAA